MVFKNVFDAFFEVALDGLLEVSDEPSRPAKQTQSARRVAKTGVIKSKESSSNDFILGKLSTLFSSLPNSFVFLDSLVSSDGRTLLFGRIASSANSKLPQIILCGLDLTQDKDLSMSSPLSSSIEIEMEEPRKSKRTATRGKSKGAAKGRVAVKRGANKIDDEETSESASSSLSSSQGSSTSGGLSRTLEHSTKLLSIASEIDRILDASKRQLETSRSMGDVGRSQREAWWKERYALDDALTTVLDRIDADLLGDLRFLFVPKYADAELVDEIESAAQVCSICFTFHTYFTS